MAVSTPVLPICEKCGSHNLPARRNCYNCAAPLTVGEARSFSNVRKDRRKYPRRGMPKLQVILVDGLGRRTPGELRDFSLGGCRVACTMEWPEGAELRLEIDGGGRGRTADMVVRCTTRDADFENTIWTIGFEFMSPTPTFPGAAIYGGN